MGSRHWSEIVSSTEGAEWVVERTDRDHILFHPWLNIVSSWFGYVLLAVIIYATHQRGVFSKRMHDVLLILFFAFISDFMEMRMYTFFIANMEKDRWDRYTPLPTTVSACTMGVWIFYAHFLNTYVEAIISMYCFATRTLGRRMPVAYVYIGLGIVFAIQASLLFESFLHGTPEDVIDERKMWPLYCTRAYMLDGPLLISKLSTAATMAIAPILSIVMMFKRAKKPENESGVTAFILLSSLCMAVLVHIFVLLAYTSAGKYLPRKFWDPIRMLLLVAYEIQYFRFPLLCLASIILVGDIRDAVLPYILHADRSGKEPIIPETKFTYNCLDYKILKVLSSSIGYFLFGLILFACCKRGLFWKRAHDVLLILFCAFIIDLMETRMHLFFIFNMHRDRHGYWYQLPTTVGACTISVWIFYSHFLITYVEAIVSIYRFTTRVIVSIYAMYAGLGLVFALKASLLFESFLHGKSEDVLGPDTDWPVFCTKAYTLDEPLLISKVATAATMLIAPILSMIMMFKRSKMQKESGVSAFTLLASLSTTFIVHFYLILRYTAFVQHIPDKYTNAIKMALLIGYNVDYLRFAWFCLAAIVLVGDIRGAVLHFILRSGSKPIQPIVPETIINDNYVDDSAN